MLLKLFYIRQFRLTNRSFLVHSTARFAPYIHLSHDSILDFPNVSRGLVNCSIKFRFRLDMVYIVILDAALSNQMSSKKTVCAIKKTTIADITFDSIQN